MLVPRVKAIQNHIALFEKYPKAYRLELHEPTDLNILTIHCSHAKECIENNKRSALICFPLTVKHHVKIFDVDITPEQAIKYLPKNSNYLIYSVKNSALV